MKNLSKSKIIRGMQCPKSLWLYLNHYDWQDEIETSQQAIFDTGNDVGILAQELFPNGVDACVNENYANAKAAQKTQELLASGHQTIYEATFIANGVLVAIDILTKEKGIWNAYEVKSNTEVKPVHVQDASIQWKVINEAGVKLNKIHIVHIDNTYVRDAALDIHGLFRIVDLTELVLENQDFTTALINECKTIAASKEMPKVEIGGHCSDPYGCSFAGHCWKHVPEYSVFNVSRLSAEKKWELYNEGILNITQIPEDFPLSENQCIQVVAEKTQENFIDKQELKNFTDILNYPLYYLDYETINPSIPMFKGMKPYEQMPFQYSLHVQESQGADCTHYEYLAPTAGIDPREYFIKQLIQDCGSKGDVIVYNIGFERGKTQKLAEQFPQYAQPLNAICERMVDLMIPFQQKWIYTPEMRGSYSIKATLPTLVPNLSYKKLAIQEGGTASAVFQGYFVAKNTLTPELKKDLLDYCKMDTWAMVRLLEQIFELSEAT